MNKQVVIAAFAAMLGSHSLIGAENILVSSTRSNSIEQFTSGGTWMRTFATTGPYSPTAIAQSPLTGEIFVATVLNGQVTNVILRYKANGDFDANWDTLNVVCGSSCPDSGTDSLLFDPSGNLFVATAYGLDLQGPIAIFEYPAASLNAPDPQPLANPIQASMYRGNQMAFDLSGNLCIAGFIDEDVQCFNRATHGQTRDYRAEIHAAGLGIEPGGLAFDGEGRLYLTSIFTGQVAKETTAGGPIVALATLISAPNLINGDMVLSGGNLIVPTYLYPAPTVSTPDAVYSVSATTGAVTNFIKGGAPPLLGNDHLWGAQWVTLFIAPGE